MIDPIALGLDVHNQSGTEAYTVCPYHDDSNPSASFNCQTGLFYCYACGARSNAKKLKALTGGFISHVKSRDLPPSKKAIKPLIDYHAWSATSAQKSESTEFLAVILQHRFGTRWEKVERISRKYGIFADKQTDNISMYAPLPDKNGIVKGVMQRRYKYSSENGLMSLTPKYVLHGSKPPIWPFSDLLTDLEENSINYISEGYMGVLNLRSIGCPAFSLLGSSLYRASRHLFKRLAPKTVCVFDDDKAGLEATKSWLKLGAKGCVFGIEADTFSLSKSVLQNLITSPVGFLNYQENLS